MGDDSSGIAQHLKDAAHDHGDCKPDEFSRPKGLDQKAQRRKRKQTDEETIGRQGRYIVVIRGPDGTHEDVAVLVIEPVCLGVDEIGVIDLGIVIQELSGFHQHMIHDSKESVIFLGNSNS